MSYYPTLEEDLERAREILAKGKVREADLEVGGFQLSETAKTAIIQTSGTIYGADVYAAYKLLESFVEEIEKLQRTAAAQRFELQGARQLGFRIVLAWVMLFGLAWGLRWLLT